MKKKRNVLTQERVKELFQYKDGELLWKEGRSNITAGRIAGNINGANRKQVCIDKIFYSISVLIWIYHYGKIEENLEIDHIDRNTLNNKVENLRKVTPSFNMHNGRTDAINKTGFRGVAKTPYGRFYAYIRFKGKTKNLGYFNTAKEASECYWKFREEHGI